MIGDLVAYRAKCAWEIDIIDPKRSDESIEAKRSRSFIDSIVRGESGLGWAWEDPYVHDGQFEWCGAFAAYCWSPWIELATRKRYFASTYRLDRWARYMPVGTAHANARRPGDPDRLMATLDEGSRSLPDGIVPRAGDILLVGPKSGGRILSCGAHITIVESYDPDLRIFSTISGNGGGMGPGGKKRQGVSKAKYTIGGPGYHARRLIRPL